MIAADLYQIYYLTFISLLCLFYYFKINDKHINETNDVFSFIVVFIIALFIGYRPIDIVFVDTVQYARTYSDVSIGYFFANTKKNEWVWDCLMYLCVFLNFTVNDWFFIVALLYLIFPLLAFKKLEFTNIYIPLLFFLSAFSTFSYSVNGIRNGLACSIIIYVIACILKDNKRDRLFALILGFAAFYIHSSVVLPLLCLLIVYLNRKFKVLKNPSYLYFIWLLSILCSLLIGQFFVDIFTSLGFDDRLISYLTTKADERFKSSGFRWDFLLYSSIPMILGLYYIYVKKIYNVFKYLYNL